MMTGTLDPSVLQQLAARVLPAVQAWHGDDEVGLRRVAKLNERTPLDGYFMRLARFALTVEMNGHNARFFAANMVVEDAYEAVFKIAAATFKRNPPPHPLMTVFRCVQSRCQALIERAYRDRPAFRQQGQPVNDAPPPAPPPAGW